MDYIPVYVYAMQYRMTAKDSIAKSHWSALIWRQTSSCDNDTALTDARERFQRQLLWQRDSISQAIHFAIMERIRTFTICLVTPICYTLRLFSTLFTTV